MLYFFAFCLSVPGSILLLIYASSSSFPWSWTCCFCWLCWLKETPSKHFVVCPSDGLVWKISSSLLWLFSVLYYLFYFVSLLKPKTLKWKNVQKCKLLVTRFPSNIHIWTLIHKFIALGNAFSKILSFYTLSPTKS